MSTNTAIKTVARLYEQNGYRRASVHEGAGEALVLKSEADKVIAELRTALEAAQQQLAQRGGSGEAKLHYKDNVHDNGETWKEAARQTRAILADAHSILTAPPAAVQPDSRRDVALHNAIEEQIAHCEMNDTRLPAAPHEARGRLAVPVEYLQAAMAAQQGEQAPAGRVNPIEGYGALCIGPDRDGVKPMLYAPMDLMDEIAKAVHAWRNPKPDQLRNAVAAFIKAKGRFHTEQGYKALVAAFDQQAAS